jgi:hypothetical protein
VMVIVPPGLLLAQILFAGAVHEPT